jgi:hypothetical protein
VQSRDLNFAVTTPRSRFTFCSYFTLEYYLRILRSRVQARIPRHLPLHQCDVSKILQLLSMTTTSTDLPSRYRFLCDKIVRTTDLAQLDDITCPLCLKNYLTSDDDSCFSVEYPVKLPCGHVTGEYCLKTWINTDVGYEYANTCPLYRAEFYLPHLSLPYQQIRGFNVASESRSRAFSTIMKSVALVRLEVSDPLKYWSEEIHLDSDRLVSVSKIDFWRGQVLMDHLLRTEDDGVQLDDHFSDAEDAALSWTAFLMKGHAVGAYPTVSGPFSQFDEEKLVAWADSAWQRMQNCVNPVGRYSTHEAMRTCLMDSVGSKTLRGPLQVAPGAYPIHRLSIDNGMLPFNIFDGILAGTELALPMDSPDDEDDFVYRMLLLALQTAYHATVSEPTLPSDAQVAKHKDCSSYKNGSKRY